MRDLQPPALPRAGAEPLRRCPECNAILDWSRPAWMKTVDATAARQFDDGEPGRWQCLICGYRDA